MFIPHLERVAITPAGSMESSMTEIFQVEYHPTNGRPRRIRFLMSGSSEQLERVTERQTRNAWREVDRETIDYFEYSDA